MLYTSTFKALVSALATGVGLASATPIIAVGNGTLAAPFGINWGKTNADNVAWVVGQSQCNNVIINAVGNNPCGRPFTLNGRTFTLANCGDPTKTVDVYQNGQYFASCASFSENDFCGVHTEYHCE